MKKQISTLFVLIVLATNTFSTVHTITTKGDTFSPDTIRIFAGDTVFFDINSYHDAVEVTEATYLINGSTSNGGFSIPYGGGSVSFPANGNYYFICEPHIQYGMKGLIQVVTPTAISDVVLESNLKIFPNPASDYVTVNYFMKNAGRVLSRNDIAEKVWDASFDFSTNVVDVYVNFLRKKIDKGHDKKLIHTKVGFGYIFGDL